LLKAAEKGSLEIVKLLIAAGADVNDANITGATALFLAADGGL
jgi:ankyrin repeat protein